MYPTFLDLFCKKFFLKMNIRQIWWYIHHPPKAAFFLRSMLVFSILNTADFHSKRQEVDSERYEHYPSIEINREWWCKINIFACTCNNTLIEEFTLYPKRILGKILPFVLIIFTALLLGVIRCRYQFYIPIMYEIKLKIHVCPRGMGFYRHCMNFKNLCLR